MGFWFGFVDTLFPFCLIIVISKLFIHSQQALVSLHLLDILVLFLDIQRLMALLWELLSAVLECIYA